MKGNEQDCICAKEKGKHTGYCDAYRLSEFLVKASTAQLIEKERLSVYPVINIHKE